MNTYTADDFANAKFAQHEHGPTAVRWAGNYHVPWHTLIGNRFSDEQMADNGWRPIREERAHIEAIAGKEARAQEVMDLRKAIEDREEVIDHLQDELSLALSRMTDAEEYAAKYEEVGEASVTAGHLNVMQNWWEQAEVPTDDTPIRDGDTAIAQVSENDFAVYRSSTGMLTSTVRVLSRVPRREPWQDLADGIEAFGWEIDSDNPKALAEYLHSKGVRVTGGEES